MIAHVSRASRPASCTWPQRRPRETLRRGGSQAHNDVPTYLRELVLGVTLRVVPTAKQALGGKGETAVCNRVACPRCGRAKQFRALPPNFECVDVICKFCGFLAQVKATNNTSGERPTRVLGGAWGPQHERVIAGIFHAVYVVSYDGNRLARIDYVPAHMLSAHPSVFKPRAKLSESARRAGWQGFVYDLTELPSIGIQQVFPAST